MSLAQLKTKISTLQSTQKVTKAMRNIAVVKMQKIKHELVLVNSNLVRMQEFYPPFFEFEKTKTEDLSNLVNVVFGPKKGLCGGLSRRTVQEFLEIKDFTNSHDHSFIAVELPTGKFLAEAGLKLKECFIDLEDGQLPTLSLLEFLSFKPQKIRLFYPIFKDHKLEFVSHLYEITKSLQDKLCLFAVIENAYYQTRLVEEQKRVEAMTQASDNCEKLGDSTKLIYFKARQSKITQEILEVSN
jgi:F-type H+-transporting ATPase subunit gamma